MRRLRSSPATLLAASLLMAAATARAQTAGDDRCSGTLCDLYYRNHPQAKQGTPAQQPPPGAQPLTVPSTGGFFSRLFGGGQQQAAPQGGTTDGQAAAPQEERSLVGGGGVAGMLRGDKAERCSGTLCDFYYGGPPKAADSQPAAGTRAAATSTYQAEPLPPPDAPDTVRRAPVAKCVAPPTDPWKCYK